LAFGGCRHGACSLRGDYRGHDIHHSGWAGKQGNSAEIRERTRSGSLGQRLAGWR
jgi:hypothetical protein